MTTLLAMDLQRHQSFIDLENNIILTQSRRKGKSKFGEHFQKVYELIDNTWAIL